jgi:hypothetical protein
MTDGQSERAENGGTIEIAGTLRAGLKLDYAIAKAIGIQVAVAHRSQILISSREWDTMRGFGDLICADSLIYDVACIPFRPSTDLDAAFTAAEKVGLFSPIDRCMILGQCNSPNGILWYVEPPEEASSEVFTAITPALAICTAILKSKGT